MTNILTLTSPLMRQTVGFDRFNSLFEQLLDDTSGDSYDGYPPYNIEKISEDTYRIIMAVAGFTMDDLNITIEGDALTIEGAQSSAKDTQGHEILHRGIATRNFKRSFRLADYILVKDAGLKDGLLTISLGREVPEEKKPRQIAINGAGLAKRLTGKKSK